MLSTRILFIPAIKNNNKDKVVFRYVEQSFGFARLCSYGRYPDLYDVGSF